MSELLDVVLLLALPASGKSEVRRYLDHLDPESCRRDFHMGPTVQLDDYPYVHLMRRTDDALAAAGHERMFFVDPAHPFRDPRDWGTLIELLNEDYDDLVARRTVSPDSAAQWLFGRIDAAASKAGVPPRFAALPSQVRAVLASRLEGEAAGLLTGKQESCPETLAGRTLVVEFARGGPEGSTLPLAAPFGYGFSLARLSAALLAKATILYIWVTPEESRRKNEARADPNDPGSILNHGVPIAVMLGDYGCDDMGWLVDHSDRTGTVKVEAHGRTWHLPVARFDNRVDRTTFVRGPKESWNASDVSALHEGLRGALERLATTPRG